MQRTNGRPACAPCKHQRKKCTDKCILAPLFPAEKTREFQAVHKVFGVCNVSKIVRNLNEEDRKRAVESLIWEAIWRQRDPVLGPYGEYRRIYEELKLHKSQNQGFHHVPPQGDVMYKGAPSLNGWNNNKGMNIGVGINDNNRLNYIHENGNSVVDSGIYEHYPSRLVQNMDSVRRETDNASAIVLPQQHSANGFNHSYYLAGQYYQSDAKPMENSLWEGSS